MVCGRVRIVYRPILNTGRRSGSISQDSSEAWRKRHGLRYVRFSSIGPELPGANWLDLFLQHAPAASGRKVFLQSCRSHSSIFCSVEPGGEAAFSSAGSSAIGCLRASQRQLQVRPRARAGKCVKCSACPLGTVLGVFTILQLKQPEAEHSLRGVVNPQDFNALLFTGTPRYRAGGNKSSRVPPSRPARPDSAIVSMSEQPCKFSHVGSRWRGWRRLVSADVAHDPLRQSAYTAGRDAISTASIADAVVASAVEYEATLSTYLNDRHPATGFRPSKNSTRLFAHDNNGRSGRAAARRERASSYFRPALYRVYRVKEEALSLADLPRRGGTASSARAAQLQDREDA